MDDSRVGHRTGTGSYHHGTAEDLLSGTLGADLKGKVQLILTSPPFPLNNKKSYGNLDGDDYRTWFVDLAPLFAELLAETGSIVIEIGNAWEPGRPVQSLLPFECLLDFVRKKDAGLRLCQEFVCYNPARLPSPAQWVTVTRQRVTDSYTRIWWMAKTDSPKADNAAVLRPYSNSMKSLLRRQKFNSDPRPSEHHISETGFLKDNGGSIAHNLFELEDLSPKREVRLPNTFALTNTGSSDFYTKTCRERGITPHPARMPLGLAAFFIEFLTDPGDLVLDPFAGSNTTGFTAAMLGRRWIAVDSESAYSEHSQIRFDDPLISAQHRADENTRASSVEDS